MPLEALSMIERFDAARRVGTPLIAITTPDPATTIDAIIKATDAAAALRAASEGGTGRRRQAAAPEIPAIMKYDAVRMLEPLNEAAVAKISALKMAKSNTLPTKLPLLLDALLTQERRPADSAGDGPPPPTIGHRAIFILSNAHRFLESGAEAPAVAQAIWNARDLFKAWGCSIVLLAPEFKLPSELRHDVLLLEEPLPDEDTLGEIVREEMKNFQQAPMSDGDEAKAVDAIRGLSAFQASQTVAMCITRQGVNFTEMRERKRREIEAINNGKGVKFYRGRETFSQVLGLDAIKTDIQGIFEGRRPPKVIVTLEEFGKIMSGSSGGDNGRRGDSNGIMDDYAAVLLGAMEDYDWPGWILYGHPGTGKTLIPKCAGATFDADNARLDIGALKGSKVGESEGAIRMVIKAFHAMAGPGGIVFMANANELGSISAEMRRRFRLGMYMFDMPTKAQLKPMWDHYSTVYKITDAQRAEPVNDDGYVPSNVRDVCDLAERRQITLAEAATRIIPVKVSDPESIILRQEFAHGRLLDANVGGVYQMPGMKDVIVPNANVPGRMIDRARLIDFRNEGKC